MAYNVIANKFQCHYKLTVKLDDNNGKTRIYTVTDPITISFNVSKVLFQSVNTATIVLKNCDREVREALYQDRLLFDKTKTKMLTLEAGYGESLTLICLGYIQQCYSERVGTDFITSIEVLDPDILTEYTSVTFKEGTTFQEAYSYLASQFPNLKVGECGQLQGEFKSPTVFEGNAFVAINNLTGGHTFIDNGVINTLNDNEVLKGYSAFVLNADTGLLGTPKRYDAVLEVNILFEPNLRLGQLVEIQSYTQSRFNGQYKINGITHSCTISGAESGTRITTLQLLYIRYLTNSNENITGNPKGSATSFIVNNNAQPLNSIINSDITGIYQEIIKNNGVIPNKRINRLITWQDMLKQDNKPADIVKELTPSIMANCVGLADRLVKFVTTEFAGHKLVIISGWRTTINNKKEKGKDNSQHLKGRAIDFKINGIPAKTVFEKAKTSKLFNGVGEYPTFTHIDVRK